MHDPLVELIYEAIFAEYLRRAHQSVMASPEEHARALATAAATAIRRGPITIDTGDYRA